MSKYNITIVYNDKNNINDILIKVLIKMICKNQRMMLTSSCTNFHLQEKEDKN